MNRNHIESFYDI